MNPANISTHTEHYHETSDKSCPKMNRSSEVPCHFWSLNRLKPNIIPYGENTKNSIFGAFKIKFN